MNEEFRIVNIPFGKFTVQQRVIVRPSLFGKFTGGKDEIEWRNLQNNGTLFYQIHRYVISPDFAVFDSISEAKLFLRWVKSDKVVKD